MEINKTKIRGAEIHVIFTGVNYFFYSQFYGPVCIAERLQETSKEEQNFILYVGNHHTTGGRLSNDIILTAAKKFINTSERKYIKIKSCNFSEAVKDLANTAILINYKFND